MSFVIAIVIMAAGLVVIVGELSATRQLEKTRDWRETTGEVLEFGLSRTFVGDYFADIKYRYKVNRAGYIGKTIRPGGRMSFRSKRLARDLEQRYRPGARIRVFYAPEDPEQCCIDREQTAGGNWSMLSGLAVFVLGLFVLFQALAA